MNKKTLRIIIGVLIVLIVAECTALIINRRSDSVSPDGNIAGQINTSQIAVTVNESQIPSYSYNDVTYIAAEDLHNFGIDMIKNSDESINLVHEADKEYKSSDGIDRDFSAIPDGSKIMYFDKNFSVNGKQVQCYTSYNCHLIPTAAMKNLGGYLDDGNTVSVALGETNTEKSSGSTSANAAQAQGSATEQQQAKIIEGSENAANHKSASINATSAPLSSSGGKIVVLDPGHGKSSSAMSESEKTAEGYVYNSNKGQWGEWRHWKSGTLWMDCQGTGCTGRHPDGGSCWYAMGNGDRATEPDINLQNTLAAKKYLEQMGYTVRMTRTSNNENPSFSKRIAQCCPNGDTSKPVDASLYLCIHSNAGGGRGSAYISASGLYDQKGLSSSYADDCNRLGKTINDKIVAQTSLSQCGGGVINGEPQLIAFSKCPVPCGYLEIGFFDSSSDLSILKSESDKIGKAIADGVDAYLSNN